VFIGWDKSVMFDAVSPDRLMCFHVPCRPARKSHSPIFLQLAVRFVMKDSIEERMIRVQKAKAALGKGSMERLSKDEEKLAGIATMKDLFQLDEELNDADFIDWRTA